jgi:DnaJ-class molecular chaperone
MMPGNTIIFSGLCSEHPQFTEAGDVTVILREADEESEETGQWSREGSRLKRTVTINLTEALLGTIKMVKGHPGYPNGLPIEIPDERYICVSCERVDYTPRTLEELLNK